MATIKGQNLRIVVLDGDVEKCVAASTECTVHLSMQVQESSSKDDVGEWARNEVVGMNWDISVNALILSEHNDESQENPGLYPEDLVVGHTYEVKFTHTSSGAQQNRDFIDPENVWLSGKAVLSDLQLVAQNKNNSTYQAQFTGVGEMEIPEDSEFEPETDYVELTPEEP